ncbi:ArnT family glycosyltransferase [Granulicella cerasi]|uniref:ArnT family glycosyltransferase n=1 Tax=Granulicella cerasi TaxID=741063 RepID=A0ABW1ZEL0_9BACT|nr:glycosyltransferase family 39 protein [Granulicella cerasi]
MHQLPSHTISYNDLGWESWEVGWTARSIFMGMGFSSPYLAFTGPTALVPPVYTYLVAGSFFLFGLNTIHSAVAILTFNSVCSSLTAVVLYFVARNALSKRAGRIAAISWALYPFAIYFSATRIWDYALTSLLFTSCILVAQTLHRRGAWMWCLFGLLYGITVMTNPSIATMLPFLLLIAAAKVWRRSHGTRGQRTWLASGRIIIASLAFAAACTPWTIRNMKVMHATFFVRDGFWEEFYAGNSGDAHESNSASTHPASSNVELQKYVQMGELDYLKHKRELSITFVKEHPDFFLIATARRVVRFWTGYWSFAPQYLRYEPFDLPNVPFCLFLLWATARGVRRWSRQRMNTLMPYIVAIVIFPLPYYLTHSSMDYRQPIEPLLILLVSIGLFGTGLERVHEPTVEHAYEHEPEREVALA